MTPMDTNVERRRCSFCGRDGTKGMRFGGGLGAMICEECVGHYHEIFTSGSSAQCRQAAQPPWESMSDADVLATLPMISRTADDVAEFLLEWVELARSRRISWAAIGRMLGVSRQAVWERFSHRVERPRDRVDLA
jgi:hypothetical protein